MNNDHRPTWAQAERLADMPEVNEALTNFSHDSSGDNAIGVVLSVLEALSQDSMQAWGAIGYSGTKPIIAAAGAQTNVMMILETLVGKEWDVIEAKGNRCVPVLIWPLDTKNND